MNEDLRRSEEAEERNVVESLNEPSVVRRVNNRRKIMRNGVFLVLGGLAVSVFSRGCNIPYRRTRQSPPQHLPYHSHHKPQ